jgi:exosortase
MIDDSGIMKSPLALARSAPAAATAQLFPARVLAIIGVVLGSFIVFWPTTLSLAERWADTVSRAYTHGSMIVVVACLLIWRRRAVLASLPAQPSWMAAAATAALGLAWLVMFRGGMQIVHQALLPLICLGSVATIFGFAVARQTLLPIGYLYFTVPLWDAFNPLLQWGSVLAVRGLLSLLGIPVYFDGLEFQIPAGRFEIADGCSGLHFFIVGLAIATLYGEWHSDTRRMRMRLLVLGVLFALITNWIRIAIIIVAGHMTHMQHHLVKEEHYSFGWFLFAGAMAIYFFIVRRWPAPPLPAAVPPPSGARAVPARGLALAAAALAIPAIAPLADANIATVGAARAHALPVRVADWERAQPAGPIGGAPTFRDADVGEQATFTRGGAAVQAFSAVYLEQSQGRELTGFHNQPLGDGFRQATPFALTTDGQWLEVEAHDAARARWLVRLSYRIDAASFTSPRRAQIAYALGSLTHDPLSSALVLRAPCAADCADARRNLEEFARAAGLARSAP